MDFWGAPAPHLRVTPDGAQSGSGGAPTQPRAHNAGGGSGQNILIQLKGRVVWQMDGQARCSGNDLAGAPCRLPPCIVGEPCAGRLPPAAEGYGIPPSGGGMKPCPTFPPPPPLPLLPPPTPRPPPRPRLPPW